MRVCNSVVRLVCTDWFVFVVVRVLCLIFVSVSVVGFVTVVKLGTTNVSVTDTEVVVGVYFTFVLVL